MVVPAWEPTPGDGKVGVFPVRILCVDLFAEFDFPPGVNLEIFSAILFTSRFPFPSNLSFAFCFLSFAPPTTFALPVEAVPPLV